MSLQTYFSTTSKQIFRHHTLACAQDLKRVAPYKTQTPPDTGVCTKTITAASLADPVLPQV